MVPTKRSNPKSTVTRDCDGQLHPKAVEGIELFNQGLYFEAHEALEAAWRQEPNPVRELYRGLLQAGVVYLHISRHNYAGAVKVFQRSQKWLTLWPEICQGILIGQLQRDLKRAIQEVQELGTARMAEFDLTLLKPIIMASSHSP